jgi:ribosomal protein S27AE
MAAADRQKVCPKCRAFLPRKTAKCPYCGKSTLAATKNKKRCRLCGGLEFKSIPVGEIRPGQKKVQKVIVCGVCGKEA